MKAREGLEGPELPEIARDVWQFFGELSMRRGSSGFGPLPITYLEIDAFQRVRGIALEPWEVEALLELDQAFLASVARDAKAKQVEPSPGGKRR